MLDTGVGRMVTVSGGTVAGGVVAGGMVGGGGDVVAGGGAGRPYVNVSNAHAAGEWLRENIGVGVLAGYFRRGGELVHCPREGTEGYVMPDHPGDSDGPAQVRMVDSAHVAATVNWTALPYKRTDPSRPPTPARFTVEVARDAVTRPDLCPALRPLRRVTHTPIVRADGSVLTAPGYDGDGGSGTLYLPPAGLEVSVPDTPTPADVAAARGLVMHMLSGFTWAGEHDLTNYVGALITPLLGELVPPPYKLVAISAPQPGSGKTLLASIARILHGGVFRSEMPEDDAELRKQVSAILDTTTGPVVVIDNVTGVLRSSALSGLLTSAVWNDRRLGSGTVIDRANDRLWIITGNNVTLGGDLARRTLWVTIDPGVPDPERRTGFAIPALERWVESNRGLILSALLALIRSWVVSGAPLPEAAGSDIYAPWRQVVSGVLTHAGIPGRFDSLESHRQSVASDDDEWRTFCEAVHSVHGSAGWMVRDLLAQVDVLGTGMDIARPIPMDALPGQLTERIEKAGRHAGTATKSMGRWLMNREGRWAGEYVIRGDGQDSRTKSRRWRVEKVDREGSVNAPATNVSAPEVTEINPQTTNDAGLGTMTGLVPTLKREKGNYPIRIEGLGSNPVNPLTPQDVLMGDG